MSVLAFDRGILQATIVYVYTYDAICIAYFVN